MGRGGGSSSSGGGHSSGGGGSSSGRSSGSFSSGGGRGGGGFSGGFGRGGGRSGSGSNRSYINSYSNHGYRRNKYTSNTYRANKGVSVTTALVVLALFIILSICLYLFCSNTGIFEPANSIKSTVERTPLTSVRVVETDYLNDEAGWISNESEVTNALKYFCKKTGVQPYLWIADNIEGSTDKNIDGAKYLEDMYNELFHDEAHLAVMFYEPFENEYSIYYVKGHAADSVLDQEAMDILIGYFNRYYYTDLDDNEFFSKVFIESADRIMSVTPDWRFSAIKYVVLMIVLIAVFLFAVFLIKARIRKRQQNIDILNADTGGKIDTEDEAERKAKEYQ
jgi:uncharacterized membrane protein